MSYWPGTNIKKSTGNAFTVRPAAVFQNDISEKMKANTARRGKRDHYVMQDAPVMPGLSEKAQRQLKVEK